MSITKRFLQAIWLSVGLAGASGEAPPGPIVPYEAAPTARFASSASAKLDALIDAKRREAGIGRPLQSSDAVFLRRVYLDTIGTLPSAEEARMFLADSSPSKRTVLIDRLLDRPEYAEFWGMRWGDILRVKSEFPVKLWPNAAQAYDRWVRDSLRTNMSYADFARALLTASGSNFRDPAVNFYRAAGGQDPETILQAVCLTFLGQRTALWHEEKRKAVASVFSRLRFKQTKEWKEEIVYFDPGASEAEDPMRLPDGSILDVPRGQDPRGAFVEWMLKSPQSTFAANGANRLWFWIFGTGLVQEPDDFRPDNPPSHPELLAHLAKDFAQSNFDTKHLLRVILNSQTYQATGIPARWEVEIPWLASYPLRPLEAEVLLDAINQVTGSHEEYMSMIPEPFTWIPQETRSISLPDGSITGTFLDLFGRPPRDSGLLTERGTRISTAQRLHLLNSRHILSKITSSRELAQILDQKNNRRQILNSLYLTILSRYPTDQELKAIETNLVPEENTPALTLRDVAWALINTPEFQLRH
jgi:hypothetical protein